MIIPQKKTIIVFKRWLKQKIYSKSRFLPIFRALSIYTSDMSTPVTRSSLSLIRDSASFPEAHCK